MTRYHWSLIAAAVAAVLAVVGVGQPSDAAADTDAPPSKTRIGTYDNRAIAVAYAPSRFNPVKHKMAEYEAAKAAGDDKKVKQLEQWGQQQQRLLHFQGFGRVPVDDLLAHVRDGVAQLAKDKHLAAIVMDCDHVAENVEVVDVTADLVELFDPSDKTRKMAARIKDAEPVSLLILADLPADE